jgi:hypothetical protein
MPLSTWRDILVDWGAFMMIEKTNIRLEELKPISSTHQMITTIKAGPQSRDM